MSVIWLAPSRSSWKCFRCPGGAYPPDRLQPPAGQNSAEVTTRSLPVPQSGSQGTRSPFEIFSAGVPITAAQLATAHTPYRRRRPRSCSSRTGPELVADRSGCPTNRSRLPRPGSRPAAPILESSDLGLDFRQVVASLSRRVLRVRQSGPERRDPERRVSHLLSTARSSAAISARSLRSFRTSLRVSSNSVPNPAIQLVNARTYLGTLGPERRTRRARSGSLWPRSGCPGIRSRTRGLRSRSPEGPILLGLGVSGPFRRPSRHGLCLPAVPRLQWTQRLRAAVGVRPLARRGTRARALMPERRPDVCRRPLRSERESRR